MNDYGSSEEHDPVTWVRGHAIYAAHLVVLVFVASMFVAGAMMFFNVSYLLDWLSFRSTSVLHGEVWRVLTYGLVNPPTQSRVLWFAIDMLMLIWFGREVEKFLGRTKFLGLFLAVYLAAPVLFTVLGVWLPTTLVGETGAFAIFIAFATLYPNVPIFFALLAKWAALILVAIYTLASLAEHDWVTLLSLWASTGVAFGYIRHQQGAWCLPKLRLPQRKPKVRVMPGTGQIRRGPPAAASASSAEIDALLDKIAQSGFASLTPKEKAKLEAARQELKKRAGR